MVVTTFFSRFRDDIDLDAYAETGRRMLELASQQPGFVSYEGFTRPDGLRVSIEAFEDEESLEAWHRHPEHRAAQAKGRAEFYSWYAVRRMRVMSEYSWTLATEAAAASAL